MTIQLGEAVAISIVVPVYRSADILEETVSRLIQGIDDLAKEYEIILVDDASPDDSWQLVEQLSVKYECVRGIQLHQNYGQHNATLCGMRAARFDLIATVDDDLQNPPDQLVVLAAELVEGVDLVYGYPESERQSLLRNLLSRSLKTLLSRAFKGRLHPRHSSFRLFRRSLVGAFDRLAGPQISIDAGLSWASNKTVAVPVRFDDRFAGTSNYDMRGLVRHTRNMITAYSAGPLRFVTASGIFAGLVGFSLMLFAVISGLFSDNGVPGFAFIASSVSLFAGIQLIGLGILGEYVGQIHFRTMGMQPYIVRQTVDVSRGGDGSANKPEEPSDPDT